LVSRLINEFVQASGVKKRPTRSNASRYEYELTVEPKMKTKCEMLKRIVWKLIIDDPRVATLQRKAEIIVRRLFDEFTRFDDVSRTREIYPTDFREKLDEANSLEQKLRIACDYISGMTDSYAARIYSRLVERESGSLMEII
jgi:dGTPase